MAVTPTPIFPQTLVTAIVTILPADTSALKTLVTPGSNGTKVENVQVTNTDTNPYVVQLSVVQSATTYLLGTVNVPASTGNLTSAAGFNILANSNFPGMNKDANGNQYLYLASGAVLKVNSTTTVATNKALTFVAQQCDF